MTPTCFSCFLRYLYVMWNLVAKFVLPPAWAGSVECPPVKMHWCRRMCLSRTACWLTMILCFAVCLQCIKMPELKFSAFCAYEGLGWKELSVFDVGRSKGYLFCSVLLLCQLRKLWLAKCIRVKSVWYLPIVEQLPTGDPQEHRLHVMVDGEIMPSGSVTKCLCFIITITRNYWMPTEGLWPLVMAPNCCCLVSDESVLVSRVFVPHPTGSLHPSISRPISWWLCLLMSIVLVELTGS